MSATNMKAVDWNPPAGHRPDQDPARPAREAADPRPPSRSSRFSSHPADQPGHDHLENPGPCLQGAASSTGARPCVGGWPGSGDGVGPGRLEAWWSGRLAVATACGLFWVGLFWAIQVQPIIWAMMSSSTDMA